MGAEPITDVTDADLECGATTPDGDYCTFAGVVTITWLGRRGHWTCPRCRAEHEEGPEQ